MDKKVKEKKVCRQQVVFCVLVVLYVFVSLLFSLPVHAAEENNYIYNMSTVEDMSGSSPSRFTREFEFHSSIDIALIKTNYTRTFISGFSGEEVTKYGYFPIYLTSDKKDINGSKYIYYGGSAIRYAGTKIDKTSSYEYGNPNSYMTFNSVYYSNFVEASCYFFFNEVETSMKIFNSVESAIKYVENGDTSGIINGGSIDNPDFEDTAYAFTGFTANNKMTATWTGTTERSYLLDQEVEEYVRVNYYFADKEAQDTIKQADAYPDEFATADNTLTIDVSGLKPDDENWFLRYIRITPCYRQAGLGVWGDFYHGSDVFVYFDVNGKIESIVQNSVPTDGEVIGNNISLIGFRYDTSFHAEFVDVWSNAVNCSAFDLGGSQYLSLGVKALYYNGQSKDIDFVSLDRKNLVWNKTFDSFKTFNGSGIKQLFFTPYIKTGVNNPWNKGNSIVIDFDVNGNATSSFDTGDDGTVHLSDFKLTGVVWNKPMLAYGTITWAGTTANSDMSIVPDSDTLVVCSYPVYDSSLNESYETYDTVTIGKGSIRVYIDSLIDKYTNAGKTWNGEMWLTPCYKKGGVLYMGEPVIVNCTKGTVSDIEVDESTGTANQVDKTDENKSYADVILSSGNNFFSIVKGLIASMQQLPELIATLFSFLPGWVNALIAGSIFVIFVCRILGR